MSGSGYYDFPDSAKPRVEISKILVCWFTTGLMLAFFAFLLKVGVDYSRGAFVVVYFLAPVSLLGVRKFTKIALGAAISKGAIGRRDVVYSQFVEHDVAEANKVSGAIGAVATGKRARTSWNFNSRPEGSHLECPRLAQHRERSR